MFDSNNPNHVIQEKAKSDFEYAYHRGFWRMLRGWITQQPTRLLSFDEVRNHLPVKGTHYVGMREIPVDHILGSVARYQDFDNAFLPLQDHTRNRWEQIDRALLSDVILPPIEVYKLGDVYFVKDGNHRVSVARERGQAFIDANVVELDIPCEFHAGDNVDDIFCNAEKIDFEERTGLGSLHPGANIQLTIPGGYDILLEHIRVHRWFMGEKRKARVSWKEAVSSWYNDVYIPLIRVIQENQILKDFPKRSEADLYLWIIEHLYYLKEDSGDEVPLKTAAIDFATRYSTRLKFNLHNFLKKLFHRP